MPRLERLLRQWGPLGAGLISSLVIWWTWGEIEPVPVIQDEASYVLQAEIFASGRWTVPAPPIPEFFEQPHVQVVPAVASKYPPGHALLLTLGALVGLPALVPVLLTGITAALLFALAARVANPWVALVAWPTWLFAPIVLRFQPTYMSEVTTTALVLASWWALLSWRETPRLRWLLTLALCVGWGAITRPLTMLVVAIPIGVVVVMDVARDRRWRDLGLAVATGVAVLAILPLWSARTTGSWRVTPIEKYRLDYLPFDKIGFTPDSTAPRRRDAMTPVLTATYDYFLAARKEQTLEALPLTAGRRAFALLLELFADARLPLLIFAGLGLLHSTPPLRFAAASALLLFLAYLPYAHWPVWTIYYLEAAPVLSGLTAVGVWAAARRLAAARDAALACTAAGAITLAGVFAVVEWRTAHLESPTVRTIREVSAAVPRLPAPGILFVRYSPRLEHNPALVRNSAHLEREAIWIVHDLGPRNDELRRAAPERASHALDLDRLVRSSAR